jgi:cell division ATPase FtsA
VDRAADNLTPDAFQDRTIEVRETAEEAVVDKTARVTEEVVIRKDVEERVETVRDTVQRTEVEVEDTRGRVGSRRSDLPGGTQADVGTDTTPGIGERTREAGHDIAADMKENRSLGDRIADAAHDAKEDLKGNTGTPRRDVER